MTNHTRRSFLKSTLLGSAAALTLPGLVPAYLNGAESRPNSKLTMGFIGMGTQSRGLLGAFLGQDTKVVAVCDVDTTRRLAAKQRVDERYGDKSAGCAAYADFRELLARKDIDAVCIATPDHWHALIVLEAVRAGKDVYCEKPLTETILEAVKVIKGVSASGRILQTGSMQRSSSEFRVACELVRNGVIGQVQRVDCSFGGPPVPCDLPEEPMEAGLDWDRWLGPAPMRPYNSALSPRGVHKHFPAWRRYSEYGGGGVTDWGAHHLDIAQWGLGMDASGPVRVVPPAKAGENKGAQLVYASGIPVVHTDGFGIDFIGSDGRVQVNRGKFVFERDKKTIASFVEKDKADTNLGEQLRIAQTYLKDAKTRLYVSQNHVSDFLGSVKSRKPPITSEQVGGRTVICCHLLNIVYLHRKAFGWDPERFTFAPGEGDVRWLTRDYRGPWKV